MTPSTGQPKWHQLDEWLINRHFGGRDNAHCEDPACKQLAPPV